MTRAPWRRRIGQALPRAEKFGDLTTADHKVLNEEGGLRNNHQYAVVVQDLATQWIQSYPCKTNTSQETDKSYLHRQFIGVLKNLVKIYHEIIEPQHFIEPTQKSIQSTWQESIASYLSCVCIDRGRNVERRYSDCGIWKNWKIWTHQNLILRRINAKEVLVLQKGRRIFTFPVADGAAKLSGRDYELREPTPRREQTVRSEDLSGGLPGERRELQPTESTDDAEARASFWSIQGDFIYRHHKELRVQLCAEGRNNSHSTEIF